MDGFFRNLEISEFLASLYLQKHLLLKKKMQKPPILLSGFSTSRSFESSEIIPGRPLSYKKKTFLATRVVVASREGQGTSPVEGVTVDFWCFCGQKYCVTKPPSSARTLSPTEPLMSLLGFQTFSKTPSVKREITVADLPTVAPIASKKLNSSKNEQKPFKKLLLLAPNFEISLVEKKIDSLNSQPPIPGLYYYNCNSQALWPHTSSCLMKTVCSVLILAASLPQIGSGFGICIG